MNSSGSLKIGVDTGGTFTDFILQVGDDFKRYKCSSTPADPSVAIMQGLRYFFPDGVPENLEVVHGTTVGTNAFLERKGGCTLLLTTQGFTDIITIGRQQRPCLFDIGVKRPKPIVAEHLVIGVTERIDAKGEVVVPLLVSEVMEIKERVAQYSVDTVVICFLNSFLNGEHERHVQELLADLNIPILCSIDILPEFREFERCSTALINGYLAPVMSSYIATLSTRLEGRLLSIQQSNGGVMGAGVVQGRAVHTLLSGPAAGVQGAFELARVKGQTRFITFDMGGTSTDVFLCADHLSHTKEYILDGYPVSIPMLDIHTVGAGGGSIAFIDQAGVLQVGPMSAGADPGPVCYGKGHELTVTDANLLLGRLQPDTFLAGRMALDFDRASHFAQEMAVKLGVTPTQLCLGIVAIVTAGMVKAVRSVSLDRGYDPVDFSLYSFGGSSGLHCCDLAEDLGIITIEIPARAGVLSAQGLVFSPPLLDRTRALFLQEAACTYQKIAAQAALLEFEAKEQLLEMVRDRGVECQSFADLRYLGQSYEISIPVSSGMIAAFHAKHRQLFGYGFVDRSVECVSLRSVARQVQGGAKLPLQSLQTDTVAQDVVPIVFKDYERDVPVFERSGLGSTKLVGPCLIVDDYTTILVTPAFHVSVDKWGGLILTKENKV